MAKVMVCDKCKVDKGILAETEHYITVSGRPDLRVDLCPSCTAELKATIGTTANDAYVQEVYRLHGIELPGEAAKFVPRT